MTGFELIIFGAGPAAGFFISFMAWLYEGYHTANPDDQPQFNPDWI
ncbi:hypothetical protein [Leptothoe sp. PORK10 BA2]|nr:hypothetical protein [Leptothoe sp. PORK10 BA2]MEA5465106.1 hypothetical protein [Leptothoe sp. PORK10 BA2]